MSPEAEIYITSCTSARHSCSLLLPPPLRCCAWRCRRVTALRQGSVDSCAPSSLLTTFWRWDRVRWLLSSSRLFYTWQWRCTERKENAQLDRRPQALGGQPVRRCACNGNGVPFRLDTICILLAGVATQVCSGGLCTDVAHQRRPKCRQRAATHHRANQSSFSNHHAAGVGECGLR